MSKASTSGALFKIAQQGAPAAKSSSQARSYWGIMSQTGLPALHHSAGSWMEWGEAVSIMEAEQGDTIILKANGHHVVGLWEAWQQDDVSVFCVDGAGRAGAARFSRKSIRAIRRLRL